MKTRSEQLLAVLAKRTFLSLWATPNPYRSIPDPRIPNREICDLLVVFGDDVVVFSDKHIEFQSQPDIRLAWSRWYRRAIEESARQLFGAKRKLRENPDRVFKDPECRQPISAKLPRPDRVRFHLVVVARGASRACGNHFGERGTLMITNQTDPLPMPFVVQQPDLKRGFVHVWDEIALEILLEHLDTTPDIVHYLRAKEEFFARTGAILIAGEEDALALYFRNPTASRGYCFPEIEELGPSASIAYDSGVWDDFVASDQYRVWRAEVEQSKVWDEFVERSIRYSPHGPDPADSTLDPTQSELLLRMLAGTSRMERRLCSARIISMVKDPKLQKQGSMRRAYVKPVKPSRPYFTFLVMPEEGNQPWAGEYREARRDLLYAQMRILRAKCQDALDIVGVALNPVSDGHCSEDYAYLDGREWSDEMQHEAEELQRVTGIFVTTDEDSIRLRDFDRTPTIGPARFVPFPKRNR